MVLLEYSNRMEWKEIVKFSLFFFFFFSQRSRYSKSLFLAVINLQDEGAGALTFLLAQ